MRKVFNVPFILAFFVCALAVAPHSLAKSKEKRAPDFPRKGAWVNASKGYQPVYKDKVTLFYFFDYTSIHCIREISLIKSWSERYKPYGLQVIWVHSPEFEFAQDFRHVTKAMRRFGILTPVFLDNDFKIWEHFDNRSWPAKHLVNSRRKIVHAQVGDLDHIQTEIAIRENLKALDSRMILPEMVKGREYDRFSAEVCGQMSGETYLGHKRAGWWGGELANDRWMKPGETLQFKDRGDRAKRGFFAHGLWTNEADAFVHARDTTELMDYIGMVYMAREVYVVANRSTLKRGVRVYVTRDDEPVPALYRGKDLQRDGMGRTYFLLEEPRLYYLIRDENPLPHEIRLWSSSSGDAINSFSFSNLCLSDFEHL